MNNNISYEEAKKLLKDLIIAQRVTKVMRRLASNDPESFKLVQQRVFALKKEVNYLLSIIKAHKAARRLYAELRFLREK